MTPVWLTRPHENGGADSPNFLGLIALCCRVEGGSFSEQPIFEKSLVEPGPAFGCQWWFFTWAPGDHWNTQQNNDSRGIQSGGARGLKISSNSSDLARRTS